VGLRQSDWVIFPTGGFKRRLRGAYGKTEPETEPEILYITDTVGPPDDASHHITTPQAPSQGAIVDLSVNS
jgi:hypothetical protein